MDYWAKLLKKADLTMIQSFVLNEGHMPQENIQTYEDRIEIPKDQLYERLHNDYPEYKEYNEINDLIMETICAYQEVFLEIGMKIGATLQRQLLNA